jgi:hypothetical protein
MLLFLWLVGDINEKDNRDCDALSGADVFGSDGPRAHWRRCTGGIIGRRCARTGWCRGRSHCRFHRGTIDCERLGFKTIRLSPAAGGARSECKLQIVCTAKTSLCGNASSSGADVCSNKRIHSTTRATAGVRRGQAAVRPVARTTRSAKCLHLGSPLIAREGVASESVNRLD